MNETQWCSSQQPYDLLRFARLRVSARKLQLIRVACCQFLADHLSAQQHEWLQRLRQASLLTASPSNERDLWQVEWLVLSATQQWQQRPALAWLQNNSEERTREAVMMAFAALVSHPVDEGLHRVIDWTMAYSARLGAAGQAQAGRLAMARRICGAFREIVGNPFQERTTVSPEWVQHGGKATAWMVRISETALTLANGILHDTAWDRMPILADALEDEGCQDHALLAHLREQVEHLPGCWALEFILGKP